MDVAAYTTRPCLSGLDRSTNNVLTRTKNTRRKPQLANVGYSSIFPVMWIVAICISSITVVSGEGMCVMDGPCEEGFGGDLNCLRRRPAQTIEDPVVLETLKIICPDLAKDANSKFCCSAEQVRTIESNFDVPSNMLGRCPACFENFKKIFCSFTCSPNQDDFLNVTATEKNNDGKVIIKEVSYYIGKTFADGAYSSCENVKGLTPGNTAIELMCGLWGANCNADRWLNFMGTSFDNGGVAPFQINFMLGDESLVLDNNKHITPESPSFHKCSDFAGADMIPCSCVDCKMACSKGNRSMPVLPPLERPWLIMGHDAMVFLTLIIGCVLAVIILIVFVYQGFQKTTAFKSSGCEENEGTDKEALSRRQNTPPGSIAATGVNLGSLEEVEPLRSKRSMPSNKIDCKSPTDSVDSENKSVEDGSSSLPKAPKIAYLPPMQSVTCLETLGSTMERMLENGFQAWGTFVATYPMFVMIPSFIVSFIMCLGLFYFKVTTDPVDLWVSPSSQARQHMDYYNTHFKPFYRIEQLIITPTNLDSFYSNKSNPNGGSLWGAAFEKRFLLEVQNLHKQVEAITAERDNRTIRLDDICLQPLSPARNICVIQSIFVYYNKIDLKNDKNEEYLDRFKHCVGQLSTDECFGAYGGPLIPTDVAFGAFDKGPGGEHLYHTSKALVITIPVLNNLRKEDNDDAMAWEEKFIEFMKNYSNPLMSVAFKGERSIEDELERGSHSDILTIAISYIIMFAYIAIALGDVNQCGTMMIDTKISLGLVGVLIVLISVVSSLGIFCFLGVPATLIIVEVIPFLVLAVGVDNIFILVQAYQRDERQANETMAQHIGRVVGEVAPSMMLSSVSMSCCFFIGALTDMPAVKIFALYAGVALLINFFLQMTCFLALFTFDTRRQESNRWDICWCVKSPKNKKAPKSTTSLLYKFFKNVYAPFLMKSWVRFIVMLSFLVWLCSSVAVIDKIELGLDQELSMPEDSYMLKYFQYLNKYLSVGPPLYFVVTDGYNYTDRKMQNRICGGGGCEENSLVSYTGLMEKFKERTYIATTVSSWLDDYIDYMRSKTCCRKFPGTENHCPSNDPYAECNFCLNPPRIPTGHQFEEYIKFFLEDIPDRNCPKAGRAQFKEAIELKNTSGKTEIGATYFMTYHTVMKSSKDFYKGLEWARHVAKEMTINLRGNDSEVTAEVIPYSLVHVFFEQYLTIWPDTIRSLGYSLAAIFLVTFVLLGLDFFSAGIVVLTIIMILVNLMGMMYWWNISLNAVSLVNLVVACGISVEFCSHLTRCFVISPEPTRLQRAEDALQRMGASILSGITLTDCGILVLVFAKSQIFQVFYFRMYVGIILFGTLHSLLFLPVFLSLLGPPVNKKRMYEHIHLQEIRSQERITINDSNM